MQLCVHTMGVSCKQAFEDNCSQSQRSRSAAMPVETMACVQQSTNGESDGMCVLHMKHHGTLRTNHESAAYPATGIPVESIVLDVADCQGDLHYMPSD